MDQTKEPCKITSLLEELEEFKNALQILAKDSAYDDWDAGWRAAHRSDLEKLKSILDKYK